MICHDLDQGLNILIYLFLTTKLNYMRKYLCSWLSISYDIFESFLD